MLIWRSLGVLAGAAHGRGSWQLPTFDWAPLTTSLSPARLGSDDDWFVPRPSCRSSHTSGRRRKPSFDAWLAARTTDRERGASGDLRFVGRTTGAGAEAGAEAGAGAEAAARRSRGTPDVPRAWEGRRA
jgi:hypothetical protein